MRSLFIVALVGIGCGENPTLPTDAAIGGDAPCTGSLSALPAMLDLGSVSVHESKIGSITIANPGTCPTDSLSLAIDGPDASSFAIASSDCPGRPLATGTTCTVHVRFAPMSSSEKTAELRIDGGGAPLVVPVSGAALTASHWYLSGSPYTFPTIQVSETSARHRFTVNNSGAFPAESITVRVTGAAAAEFPIDANTCVGTLPLNGTCYIDVVFQPTTVGTKNVTLEVHASLQPEIDGAMLGTALPYTAWTNSPSLIDFMSIQVNQTSATKRFTITNTGSVSSSSMITVSFDGPNAMEFGLVANTCSLNALPAGGSCYVDVEFHPTSLGAKNASLELRDSVLGSLSAPMMGTAP